jgi:hypothetical protein
MRISNQKKQANNSFIKTEKLKNSGKIYLNSNLNVAKKDLSTSEKISNVTIKIGESWAKFKSINNDEIKRGVSDSDTILDTLKKINPKNILYSAGSKVLTGLNAATSGLDVLEAYAKDSQDKSNYTRTIETIVKGTSKTIIAGMTFSVVYAALTGLGITLVGAPVLIGGIAGGATAYGFGKLYDSSKNWI